MYEKIQLFLNGQWVDPSDGDRKEVINPATETAVGDVPVATAADLNRALELAEKAFLLWRRTSPWERAKVLKRAASLIENRKEQLACVLTLEQGKPLAESRGEIDRCAEVFEWCAEEAVRCYGRVLPQRTAGARQAILKEPVGPVAAFTPWNFPAILSSRKIAAALAAGCSIILKPAHETPGAVAGIVDCLAEAGLPKGVLGLVYGNSSMISDHLVRSPVIRKVSLTGSIRVGRILNGLAGELLKPATMELGGHAPVIVFADADLERAAQMTAAFKYRNAGQVCLGVSRIFVQEEAYETFLAHFLDQVKAIKVGNGMTEGTTMGPVANIRQIAAMEHMVEDALESGSQIVHGGARCNDFGYFFEPTVLTEVPDDSVIMTEEPFGPVVPLAPFATFDEVVARANSLPFGLAGYAFTSSLKTATHIADAMEVGWVGINDFTPALAEAPFGGMKDSGVGYEGGPEGFEAYCKIKFVSQMSG